MIDLAAYARLFGLIGYPLSHSFSKRYFSEKFAREHIADAYYELFPLKQIDELPDLISTYPNLVGLNVTIPYKQAVLPYLDDLDPGARAVGAVNTIKIAGGKLAGFNSDVYGFEQSLRRKLERTGMRPTGALVLGTGGAARAVTYVLQRLEIPYLLVSRTIGDRQLSYDQVDHRVMERHQLIINTTPLGMSPNLDTFPPIPYEFAAYQHLFFDLVYNPEETVFLRRAAARGAATQSGLEMLYRQAERSWEFWQT